MLVPDTTPYPWPYHGALDAFQTALVVTGAQGSFAGTPTAGATLERIEEAADRLRALGVVIVWVRHTHPAGARCCPGSPPRRGSAGWDFAALPDRSDVVVDACGFNGFFGSALDAELRSRHRDTLVMAGLALESTVDTTMRGANDRGYECLLARDLVDAIDPATGRAVESSCAMSGGIFGAVGTSVALLSALGDGWPPPSASVTFPGAGESGVAPLEPKEHV